MKLFFQFMSLIFQGVADNCKISKDSCFRAFLDSIVYQDESDEEANDDTNARAELEMLKEGEAAIKEALDDQQVELQIYQQHMDVISKKNEDDNNNNNKENNKENHHNPDMTNSRNENVLHTPADNNNELMQINKKHSVTNNNFNTNEFDNDQIEKKDNVGNLQDIEEIYEKRQTKKDSHQHSPNTKTKTGGINANTLYNMPRNINFK